MDRNHIPFLLIKVNFLNLICRDKRRYELIEVSCSKELISVLAVENSGALDE